MQADLTQYSTYPFFENHLVRPLEPKVDEEPPRHGEGGVDCHACTTADDDGFIWVNERWRLGAFTPSAFRGVVLLSSRAHFDGFGDMPREYAAEFATIAGRVERATFGLGGIGRVHTNRWADGGAHFHVWFYPRPYGQLQLRGTFLNWWTFLLPDLPDDVLAAAHAQVAQALAADDGLAIKG